MKDTNIGSRLLMAASFVNGGGTVCDVGCDHGKLSLYLIETGRAKKIIATDINKKPLQKAIDLFAENKLSHTAEFHLTDGLQGIDNSRGDITHIVIAGMGGNTMTGILENAPFVKKDGVKLVLLPAQRGFNIREYLYAKGFEIEEEKTVSENGKYYTCISARYTGQIKQADIYDIYIGRAGENTGDSAKGYLSLVLRRLEKIQQGFVSAEGGEREDYAAAIDKIKTRLSEL